MPEVIIENFRHGLDSRRSVLTSVLGTLRTLVNAHINQGGEIEKRKAFVPISILPTVASNVGTILGVEALRDSIVLFGGQVNDDAVNWPPAGFTYQRLFRDAAASAAALVCNIAATPGFCSYCEGYTGAVEATSIIYSTVYGGKTFALALMSDGTYNAFYDAVVVPDINFFGRIFPDMGTTTKMLCEMVTTINATTGYTADIVDDGAGHVVGVNIVGNTGKDFNATLSVTGALCNGVPKATFVSSPTPNVPGKIATGSFQVQDGYTRPGVSKITSILVGATELLTAAVNYNTDPTITAAAIVAAINTNVAAGYTANNQGNTVSIYDTATGTGNNAKNIKVTTAGLVMIGRCSLVFALTGATFTLSDITVDGTTILTAFNGVFPTAAETLSSFMARVRDNINAHTGTHGIVSLVRDNVLKLSKQVTQSNAVATADDSHPISAMLPVVATWTGAAMITDGADPGNLLSVNVHSNVEPSMALFLYHYTTDAGSVYTFRSRGLLIGAVVGGVPPYTYLWRVVEQTDGMNIVFETPKDVSTIVQSRPGIPFASLVSLLTRMRATIVLDVVDANGSRGTSNAITVTIPTISG
jgi:hypothetical protein